MKVEIKRAHEEAERALLKQRIITKRKLDEKIEDIKNQTKNDLSKKQETNYDFKAKEKELNEHLETMT